MYKTTRLWQRIVLTVLDHTLTFTSHERKAVALRPKCVSIVARAAHGLLRIKPTLVNDKEYIKELLDYVGEVAPHNPFYYHDLAYYYDRFEDNVQKAIECMKIAISRGNSKGLIYLTTLKWKCGLRHEILADLEKGLIQYKLEGTKAMILSLLVVYTLLIKEDWKTALAYTNRSLELDSSGKYFVNYQSLKGGNVNVIEMMMSKLCDNTPPEAREEYEQFVELTSGLDITTCKHTDFYSWKRIQMQARRKF